jgi:hypothetical protein
MLTDFFCLSILFGEPDRRLDSLGRLTGFTGLLGSTSRTVTPRPAPMFTEALEWRGES